MRRTPPTTCAAAHLDSDAAKPGAEGRSGDIEDPISSSRQSRRCPAAISPSPRSATAPGCGIEPEFRALYRRHYRSVLAYILRRCRDDADAHDALAETFVVAWRRFERIPDGDHASLLWLYGVARRVLANQRRGLRRRAQLSSRLEALPRPIVEFEADMVSRAEADVVLAAMAELRPKDREILLLAAWEGLSHAEIGTVMGCSENASAIRLHRARQHLSEASEKDKVGLRTTPGYRRPQAEEGLS